MLLNATALNGAGLNRSAGAAHALAATIGVALSAGAGLGHERNFAGALLGQALSAGALSKRLVLEGTAQAIAFGVSAPIVFYTLEGLGALSAVASQALVDRQCRLSAGASQSGLSTATLFRNLSLGGQGQLSASTLGMLESGRLLFAQGLVLSDVSPAEVLVEKPLTVALQVRVDAAAAADVQKLIDAQAFGLVLSGHADCAIGKVVNAPLTVITTSTPALLARFAPLATQCSIEVVAIGNLARDAQLSGALSGAGFASAQAAIEKVLALLAHARLDVNAAPVALGKQLALVGVSRASTEAQSALAKALAVNGSAVALSDAQAALVKHINAAGAVLIAFEAALELRVRLSADRSVGSLAQGYLVSVKPLLALAIEPTEAIASLSLVKPFDAIGDGHVWAFGDVRANKVLQGNAQSELQQKAHLVRVPPLGRAIARVQVQRLRATLLKEAA